MASRYRTAVAASTAFMAGQRLAGWAFAPSASLGPRPRHHNKHVETRSGPPRHVQTRCNASHQPPTRSVRRSATSSESPSRPISIQWCVATSRRIRHWLEGTDSIHGRLSTPPTSSSRTWRSKAGGACTAPALRPCHRWRHRYSTPPSAPNRRPLEAEADSFLQRSLATFF